MSQQAYGLRDPILELINRALQQRGVNFAAEGEYGIDHTHLFESDEPPLLKPFKLTFRPDGRLDKVTMGEMTLMITVSLIYDDVKYRLKRVEVLYPDGVTVPYDLTYGDDASEQQGKLIEVV